MYIHTVRAAAGKNAVCVCVTNGFYRTKRVTAHRATARHNKPYRITLSLKPKSCTPKPASFREVTNGVSPDT